jgi:protein phosphatase
MAKKLRIPDKLASVRAAALTDVGKMRQANEDAFARLPEQGLFIVSDGMGGHQAGATASKIVVRVLPKMIEQRAEAGRSSRNEVMERLLRDTIVDLSRKIREQSVGQLGLAGMGATVVLAYLWGEKAFLAHMGDSRAYLYRRRKLKQLTKDHSVVGILLRRGEITPDEARKHPARSRLSRYMGMDGEVYPDVEVVRLLSGDRLLLCTDGLTGPVPDRAIAKILGDSDDPDAACRALVEAANVAGGPDNITVLVIDWPSGKK